MERPVKDEVERAVEEQAAATQDGARGAQNGGRGTGRGMDGGGMGMGMGGGGGGGGAPFSLRDLRTFTSFKNPVFRLYFAAMVGQMAAMNMQMIARSLLVFSLTGSGTALGLMALGNALPMLFFSLFGGVIADRVQKKYVLLAGQAASAVVSFAIALTLVFGLMSEERSGSWFILVIAALFQGTIMGLMMPSRQAMIAEIVGEEDLMNAVALNSFGMNALRLLAPVPVGFIIFLFDFQAVYFAMTAMYVMAVFFIFLMPKTGTITLRGRGALQEVADGIRYVRHEATILTILLVTLVVVLLSMPYMMLLPALTEDVLEVDSRGFGLLLSVSGIGAMIGSIVLASLPNKRRGLMLMVGSLILGLALIGLFFSSSWFPSYAWPLALIFIVFVGLGQTTRMTLGNTLLQYYVEDEYRGRVMSLYFMEFGLTSFGVFFAGVLTDMIGVQWAVGGLAIILVFFSMFTLAFVPRLRRLD
jgi:MFS family permease